MNAIKRDELGKQANNKIRKSGLVPAVVYGRNKENLNMKNKEALGNFKRFFRVLW